MHSACPLLHKICSHYRIANDLHRAQACRYCSGFPGIQTGNKCQPYKTSTVLDKHLGLDLEALDSFPVMSMLRAMDLTTPVCHVSILHHLLKPRVIKPRIPGATYESMTKLWLHGHAMLKQSDVPVSHSVQPHQTHMQMGCHSGHPRITSYSKMAKHHPGDQQDSNPTHPTCKAPPVGPRSGPHTTTGNHSNHTRPYPASP